MIGLAKPKKLTVRTKHNATDTQCNVIDKNQNYESFDPTIRNSRATKYLAENCTKNCNRSSNHCKVEKCQSKSPVCSSCQLVHSRANEFNVNKDCEHQAWNMNGNLRNSFFSYENFKESCVQHNQSNTILPSISTYLKKGIRQKSLKWNNIQTCPDETFKKDGEVDKYIIPCQFKGRLYDQGNSNPERLRSNEYFSTDNKTSYVNYEQSNADKTLLQISSAEGNLSYRQTLSDTNLQSANHFQNYTTNGAKPSNGTVCIQSPDQTRNEYNVQYVRGPVFLQEPKYNRHFSQQFQPNSFKWVVVGQQFGWYFVDSLPNQQLCNMTRQIPEYSNGIQSDLNYFSSETVIRSQKAQGACYGDQINYGYRSNPSMVDFDHDNFARKNFARPTIPVQNEQQFVENGQCDVKCKMRPILKGTMANLKVNY